MTWAQQSASSAIHAVFAVLLGCTLHESSLSIDPLQYHYLHRAYSEAPQSKAMCDMWFAGEARAGGADY